MSLLTLLNLQTISSASTTPQHRSSAQTALPIRSMVVSFESENSRKGQATLLSLEYCCRSLFLFRFRVNPDSGYDVLVVFLGSRHGDVRAGRNAHNAAGYIDGAVLALAQGGNLRAIGD